MITTFKHQFARYWVEKVGFQKLSATRYLKKTKMEAQEGKATPSLGKTRSSEHGVSI